MNNREINLQTQFKAAQLEATIGEVGLIEDIAIEISEVRDRAEIKNLGLIMAFWKNLRFSGNNIFDEFSTLVWTGKKRYIGEVRAIIIAEEVEPLREKQSRVSQRADSNKNISIAYTAYGVPIESLKILANTDRSSPRDVLDTE